MDKKVIYELGSTTVSIIDGKTVVESNQREPKATTVQTIIEEWVENNYKNDTVNRNELEPLVHSIILDNILWVSGNMLNEVSKVTKNILNKKDLENYPVEYVVKQVAQHYRVIYKRKMV